ncbi:MAG: hypothetical protein KC708_09030 [Anaerolineae bacterium]|nr:hypothetical protein [Anaerolineae bacterium]
MTEKIALGFGNNIDYEIAWNTEAIKRLILEYDIHDDELSIDHSIRSERDLVVSILGFMKIGSGGERFVASSDIIEEFSRHFENKITLGGTSVRAAIAMRMLGYTSALHLVTTNDQVRKLIPSDSPFVCSGTEEKSYPHLIVQFGKNICVQANDIDICTKHATRLIYHSDSVNIEMNINEDFADLVTGAKVFLISGFNAMHSEELFLDRIESLKRIMDKLPGDALVYYEDAGFHEPRFSPLMVNALADYIDIYALNEDELQGYLHRQVDLLDVGQVRQALADLKRQFPIPTIIVHTQYWALAYGDNAAQYSKALKSATTLATTRFCYGDDITREHYQKIENFAPNPMGAEFADKINGAVDAHFCCVPVAYIEQQIGTTVGLGDAFVGGFLPMLLG